MSDGQVQERSVTLPSNGQVIHYVEVGKPGGKPVLALTGALGTHHDMRPQFDPDSGLVATASKELRLFVWDPPGYGKSKPHDRK